MVRSSSPSLERSEETQNQNQGQQDHSSSSSTESRLHATNTTATTSSTSSTSSSPVPHQPEVRQVGQHPHPQQVPHGLALPPSLDPEQMYIVSGPFTCYGQPTMIAYPIPRGATVIATPSMRPMSVPSAPIPIVPSLLPVATNPEFRPTYPTPPLTPEPSLQQQIHFQQQQQLQQHHQQQMQQQHQIQQQQQQMQQQQQQQQQQQHGQKTGFRPPSALIWNAYTCPEGRLMPLRQTQPPVYFYQNNPEQQQQEQQQQPQQQQQPGFMPQQVA